MSNTRRRVKLYVLNEGNQWDDHGTGHVSSMYLVHGDQQEIVLLVLSEDDGSLLLESRIQTDTVYQKQQDTLIVWSEDDSDLALSFQEKEGCDEIWEKICQVQGKHPSVDITQDVEEDEEHPEELLEELPPCELSRLGEIQALCLQVLSNAAQKDKLATALEEENYVKKLFDVFHMCEDLDNTEGLHHLFQIFKAIFMLNKNSLFELMLSDDAIFDVVGILEYDPNKQSRMRHRDFLRNQARFKEVIPVTNEKLLNKIHQTYRVQYIQDVLVPVPSLFEENMSTLSSFIFFNKIAIVDMIQNDSKFISELFSRLTDDEISDDKRKELVLFLKELCNLSQTLQQHNRDAFLKCLSSHGLLSTLQMLLNIDDDMMKSALVDILCCIAEYSPTLVREYMIDEGKSGDEDSLLINMLIELMTAGGDSSMSVLLLCLLRMLLDPENMGLGANKMERSEFLSFFYKHSMHVLTAVLFAVTSNGDTPSKDDFKTVTTLDHILDVLSFCVEHHTNHIKTYIISKELLRRVLVLLKSKHAFLALAAIRLLRKIIGTKDEFYNRHMIKWNLFGMVVDCLLQNGERYNLLNSAIIELFDFIRLEDIKSLCAHIVESEMSRLEAITYVQTFTGLKLKYDQEKDRQDSTSNMDSRNSNHGVASAIPSRFRRDAREMDEDEEMYFGADDDDADDGSQQTPTTTTTHDSYNNAVKPISARLKDVDLIDNLPPRITKSPPPLPTSPTSQKKFNNDTSPPKHVTSLLANNSPNSTVNCKKLGGLVDYPDDEEEETEDQDVDLASPAKKPRIMT